MKKMDFEKTLLEAVDHALLSLGESPRQAIYYHLNKSYKLQKNTIPEEADEFSEALSNIFGPGAEVIQKIIVKNLYSRLNLSLEEKTSYGFVDYINLAREVVKRDQQRIMIKNRKRGRKNPIELE